MAARQGKAGKSSDGRTLISLKIKVVKLLVEGATNKEIAVALKVPLVKINHMVENETEVNHIKHLLHARQARGSSHFPDVDRALFDWFCLMQQRGTPVTTYDVKKKANDFANNLGYLGFFASKPWFKAWKKKFSIVPEKDKGPKVENMLMPPNVENYTPDDVYMMKELAMYPHLLPFADEEVDSGKMTVLLSCNLSGSDRRPLLLVTDRAIFSELADNSWHHIRDPSSWISTDIFVNWLMDLDDEMIKQDRKIVLIVEKSPIHPTEVENDLANVKLIFMESNSSPKHPGVAIARDFKACYRRKFYERHLLKTETPVSDVDMVTMLLNAWSSVTSDKITSCFWNSGYKLGTEPSFGQEDIPMEIMSAAEFDDYVDLDVDFQCYGVRSDIELCEGAVFRDWSEKKPEKAPPQPETNDRLTKAERDALESLSVLRRYYETNDLSDFSSYYALETQVMDQICKKFT